jgi:hypothetical protein
VHRRTGPFTRVVHPADAAVRPRGRLPGLATPRAFTCSWAFALLPAVDDTTRLLARSRVRLHPGWLVPLAGLIRAGDTVMQRAMLTGIKRRVEQAQEHATGRAPARTATGTGRPSDRAEPAGAMTRTDDHGRLPTGAARSRPRYRWRSRRR